MSWFSVQKYRKELVNDLCEALKNGTAPWQQPWSKVVQEWPINALTGHHYSYNNAMKLYARAKRMGYTDCRWLTYRQAQDLGGHVKLGEKGTYIQFYIENGAVQITNAKREPVLNTNGEPVYRYQWILKRYVVFNAEQISGLTLYVPEPPKIHAPVKLCEKAERILQESGAKIHHGGDEAYYDFGDDFIQLPKIEEFHTSADYYATALHELSHWTGHVSRLNRNFCENFGREAYAFEELVAEISSMFVSAETGIDQTQKHFDNHAAYVSSWLEVIKQNSQSLINAVKLAHQASDFILKNERARERADEKKAS